MLFFMSIQPKFVLQYVAVQSVSGCPTLCDPMECSTPGFPVLHHLPELAQTHVHWVGVAITHLILCHPLLLLSSIFPSIRVFSNESDLPIRCQSIGALALIFPMSIQDWFPLGLTGSIFMLSKGLSRVFASITVQKHQFCGARPSLRSNSHIHTWLLKKP